MPTDDEMLERVRRRATVLRRRQRVLVAGAAAVVVAALMGGAVVASTGRGGDPVEAEAGRAEAERAERPDDTAPTSSEDPDGRCATLSDEPTDRDLGPATAGPGGSPTASTDGRGSEASSSPSTTTDPRPARRDPAGAPPAESSASPDGPPVATAAVRASSTACPLHVRITAVPRAGSTVVDLSVTATAEAFYDAHGFVVWDAADPVRVDLGAVERSPGSCGAASSGDVVEAAPVRGDFTATHTYPGPGDKELTVTFWARRCGGPVHQVAVSVTVPI